MSKNLKKLLALVFAMAMALSLVACGGGEDAEAEETEDTTAAETEDAEAEETEDAEAEEGEEAEETEDAEAAEGFDLSVLDGAVYQIGFMNGVSYEDNCAASGLDPAASQVTWTFSGEECTIEGNGVTNVAAITATADGFTMSLQGQEFPVVYNAEDGSLVNTTEAEGQVLETVMVPVQ